MVIGHVNRRTTECGNRKGRKSKEDASGALAPADDGSGGGWKEGSDWLADLNCATQLWPLPFDRSNAPLEKERADKASGICGYEDVTCTKAALPASPAEGNLPTLFSRC